ncbi:MAG: methylmalonyl-CoA mutase [Flavobacteriales bacterium]|nr:methylmalonyl-CoA mutase [Flavobacteriales bacterium]|tara:strand:+ start:9018 stop:12374 length:3357 start_codon:yes stop_codon:yes gene_type:complete
MIKSKVYKPKYKIRIVTAASLFDGHDASINIMRRILQATGCEVIHLGHDRSVEEIVDCAIQEDANAIAITSYQGGHMEYFKYMYDLLKIKKSEHIKIFGGGGGTILIEEIKELHKYGITRIYHPDDGRKMGLQGMINDLVMKSDFKVIKDKYQLNIDDIKNKNHKTISRLISLYENSYFISDKVHNKILKSSSSSKSFVLGITGTGGAGKSSFLDEIIRRLINDFDDLSIGVVCVDPSKKRTGGALLGDRIRMNSIHNSRVFMRSMATRRSNLSLSKSISETLLVMKAACFDLIILETSGIGQSDVEITDYSDLSMYVMTPEFGAPTQLEKIDMLDFADIVVLNKFDKLGALDALRDVKKQYQRNNNLFNYSIDTMPVYGVVSSNFNDNGLNLLYFDLINMLKTKSSYFSSAQIKPVSSNSYTQLIPSKRIRYLSEISDLIREYNCDTLKKAELIGNIFSLNQSLTLFDEKKIKIKIQTKVKELRSKLNNKDLDLLDTYYNSKNNYKTKFFSYLVRDKEVKVENFKTSLSGTQIPVVATPKINSPKDIFIWLRQENFPGQFPYTSGIYPFKRRQEDPTRMFAGEGSPERTNHRFHYLSNDMESVRLSTAFDSVTLYGRDPDKRPDIYGKIGNAGVSVFSVDDAKKLYSGFNLCDPSTSVSMTINGPAPIILAFFLNAAIDQQCELYIKKNKLKSKVDKIIANKFKNKKRPIYYGDLPDNHNHLGLYLLGLSGSEVLDKDIYEKIKSYTLSSVRGTVQADILKEDQAQNTCIFSTQFALKMMADIQEYFIQNKIRNFYSVSISGYHIAEAGANPITQLAFTLANGFTYVEYYLSRGMNINDFAPNLSFFFSNGIDPEYAVIGRVARRIWSKAMKYKYGANERSQKLKYHIQTSGRSLHAQEISFNDIRTTLQALYAIYDNCNSLHTNAYDEAITTPTEESVRRALAIQLIINKELGLAKNENPLQGSFIIEELTDLVEEAVLKEFDSLTERGSVLGAMERMYQRGKIQEESIHYETLKHTGEYPIIGVNTFIGSDGSPTIKPDKIFRSSSKEKKNQIKEVANFKKNNEHEFNKLINKMTSDVQNNKNIFDSIIDVSQSLTLGQITDHLFKLGGEYRRNM